ncbi:MAG: hypothetical protein FWF44_05645, partial [Defluviitaleaceae bacterium]|nr:hypothetical protein [Defluviitaleaceae bacterium]
TLRDIRFSNPTDEAVFLQIGGPYGSESVTDPTQVTDVGMVIIDNVMLVRNGNGVKTRGIEVKGPIKRLIVNNTEMHNLHGADLVTFSGDGRVGELITHDVLAD